MRLSEQVAAFKRAMEAWEKGLGIGESTLDPADLDAILNMDRTRLAAMTSRQAAEAAFVVSQFAFALQHRDNQCRAFLQWANANRNAVSGPDRTALAEWGRQAELRQARIAYLARRLEFVAQCLGGIQRIRQKEEQS